MKNHFSFPHLINIVPSNDYSLKLEYSDGVKGELNLSHLLNKGVFTKWNDLSFFKKVFINKENGSIAWDEEIELCPDSQYLKLIGKTFEEWEKTQKLYE